MTELLTNFHFLRPVALLLVPVAIVVWLWWHRRADPLRGWRAQIDPTLLDALTTGRDRRDALTAYAIPIAWFLASLAIAGPTWKPEPSPFADDATPLMILLKADASMDQPDPAPSRIERARLKIADLAEARKGQPLGLIAFAGSAHLVLPPTRDTAVVAQMAAEISSGIMPEPGDRLDLALRRAREVLGDEGGSILIIADSVDTQASLLKTPDGVSIQMLAINSPDSSQADSMLTAGRVLGAPITPFASDDSDVESIVRRAARTPVSRAGETGDRWQEAGYWLVPIVALLVLGGFRREEQKHGLEDSSS